MILPAAIIQYFSDLVGSFTVTLVIFQMKYLTNNNFVFIKKVSNLEKCNN